MIKNNQVGKKTLKPLSTFEANKILEKCRRPLHSHQILFPYKPIIG